MDENEVISTCLSITSFFEGSSFKPLYTNVTGNFDGQGISVGVLQWNAGTGSLPTLLKKCLELMDVDTANNYFSEFGDSVVSNMSGMSSQNCMNYCLANFIDGGSNKVTAKAKAAWQNFLGDEQVIEAQKEIAISKYLKKALALAASHTPEYQDNLRAIAYFFDTVTQSGGMSNSKGSVDPVSVNEATSYQKAIDEARAQGKTWTADKWENAIQDDPLAKLLLHYAYERSRLSASQWQWNTLARRGTIATRFGYVNSTKIDLTSMLP